jgi:hypothetical protein
MRYDDSTAEDSPDNLYVPIANSSERYSFHESEYALLDWLRKWSREHFSTHLIYSWETHLPEGELGFAEETKTVRSGKDFDILGKVTRIKRIDDTFALVWFKDMQGTLFEIRLDTNKFSNVGPEAVLRFRAVILARMQRRDKDLAELKQTSTELSMSELLAYQLETTTHSNVLLF